MASRFMPSREWLAWSVASATSGERPRRARIGAWDASALPSLDRLVTIGSAWEDRLRVAQLLGLEPTHGFLIRSPSTLTPPLPEGRWPTVRLIAPEFRSVSNSAIPFSFNDGVLWGGRGTNHQYLFGMRARYGPVSLTLAPQFAYSENREFEILPPHLYRRFPHRDPFASIWHVNEATVDMPYRFGDEEVRTTTRLGQSALTVDLGRVAFGFSNENQWWGPGIRNAILMSNNAPGVPHLYLRTGSPLRTRIGDFEGRWQAGWLEESAFFDSVPDNDRRTLSAIALTYAPRWEPNLTLGIARSVYAVDERSQRSLWHAFDVFDSWERRDSLMQVEWEPESDQILSVFARWVLPSEGVEVYGEWARHELPVSFRDLLMAPHHTRGYTVGLQWARPIAPGVLRLQGEVTQLEMGPTFRQRPIDTFYTGRSARQGYTHHGQVIGAAIGPGSSSQWLAADLLHGRGHVGAFGGRIRWENDALYSSPSPRPERGFHRTPFAHDVSVYGGLRAGVELAGFEIRGEVARALRYNYLFQNPDLYFTEVEDAVDIWNTTFRFEVTPARPGRLRRPREVQ